MNKRKKTNKAYHDKMTQKLAGILAGFNAGIGAPKSRPSFYIGPDKIDPKYK